MKRLLMATLAMFVAPALLVTVTLTVLPAHAASRPVTVMPDTPYALFVVSYASE